MKIKFEMVKASLTVLFVSVNLGTPGLANAEGPIPFFHLMHTLPECSHSGKASTWCDGSDKARTARSSGMEQAVVELLDQARDPRRARVTIAYFSFSNKTVFQKLCALGRTGIRIEGFFDSSENRPESYATQLTHSCQSANENNVRIHFLGTKEPWRLHHNKFLLVDTGNDELIRMGFSSGNLSDSGLSVHFDHWVFMEAKKSSNLIRQQFCVVKSLRRALDPQSTGADLAKDDPRVYRESLNRCLVESGSFWNSNNTAWIETALAKEKIAPLFAPDPSDSIASVLINQINSVIPGGRIRGAIQHFLHQGIAQALRNAVKRGVQVTLLMDDDVLVGAGVPGAREFFDTWLDPKKSGIDIGFIQTNSDAKQMMHNKFLILEGVGNSRINRVFSGAGHFTKAATKNNYENFYLSQVAELTSQYEKLFSYMNERRMKY